MGGCCDNNTNRCIGAGLMCSGQTGVCANGGCQNGACGRLGQPACMGDVACTAPFTVEAGGQCVACGGVGQRCCNGRGGDFCGAGAACGNNNQCEACGGSGQLCCLGRFCNGTAACQAGTGRCP